MTWDHLSDSKGTDAGFIAEKYVYAFPTYILIAPDGTVVAQPYSIERLKEVLAAIFQQ